MITTLTVVLLVVSTLAVGARPRTPATVIDPPRDFDGSRASFSVSFHRETTPLRVIAAFVLPGETLRIEAVAPDTARSFDARSAAGRVTTSGPRRFQFQPPGVPGVYPLTVRQLEPADSIRINVFVMVPYSALKGEHLNGYRIGAYPDQPLRGLAIYEPPRGFIEVTPQNRETLVGPHFTLGQFLCKQESGWPKYVVLRERLIVKLEMILAAVNDRGFRASTLVIMSGYRTPFYNRAIGNVRYSRHVWGGAADIYIDEHPRDGLMDDLNGDGRIDQRDAVVLYDIIDRMYGQPWYRPLAGGLGRYRKTANHGPFVHVDVRGSRARWGT